MSWKPIYLKSASVKLSVYSIMEYHVIAPLLICFMVMNALLAYLAISFAGENDRIPDYMYANHFL